MKSLNIINCYHVEPKYVTTKLIDPKADWLVCVDVLEQLDNQLAFLQGLRRNIAAGGQTLITASLDAARADHIYLCRNVSDLLVHLNEVGIMLKQLFVGSAYKPASPLVPVHELLAFNIYY
jgi:hypothetical protein